MAHQINGYRIERYSVSTIARGVMADIILFVSIISLTALTSLTGA